MKACADSVSMLRCALLGLAVLAAGCAGPAPKPDAPKPPPATAPGTIEEPGPEAEAPKDPEALFEEALGLMRQHETAKAEAAFLALAKEFPEFSGPHTNLGIIFATTKRPDAAIVAFTRAATVNPGNALAFNWLGILNRQKGDHERARLSFEKAIEVEPQYAAAHLNLGLLHEQLQQPDQAITHYQRYRALAGEDDLRVLPWIAELEARAPAPAQIEAEAP